MFISFTNADFMNDASTIGLSQMNFEIISTSKMNNGGSEF